MARCMDCCHLDVCKDKLEELCKFTKIEDLIHNCSKFKDRQNYVEVVRCKDCIHYDFGVCLKIYSDGAVSKYAWQARKDGDFCSYGERREGE